MLNSLTPDVFYPEPSFHNAIFDSLDEGVLILDELFNLHFYNEKACQILRLKPEQLIGKNLLEFSWHTIREDGSEFLSNQYPVTITQKTGIPQNNVRIGLIFENNSISWIRTSTKLVSNNKKKYIFCALIDISKEIESTVKLKEFIGPECNLQENLLTYEQRWKFALEGSGLGVWDWDILEKKWFFSDTYCRILGYDPGELQNSQIQCFLRIHSEDRKEVENKLEAHIKGDTTLYHCEFRMIKKDGSFVWIEDRGQITQRDESGQPTRMIGTHTDIEARKVGEFQIIKLQEELKAKNNALVRASINLSAKITKLEEFNKIVSHNLHGPAVNISTLIEMTNSSSSIEDKEESMKMLGLASEALNNTLKELAHVLEIQLNNQIGFDECDIFSVIEKVKDMLIAEIRTKKAHIEINLSVVHLAYPKIYLESIFYNLISNALKYSKQDIAPHIIISTVKLKKKVLIKIQDNGLGLDLDKYGHQLFKLKQVFHSGYDSKGVGLFITKNQIETFGGSISIESTPGIGSTFSVIL